MRLIFVIFALLVCLGGASPQTLAPQTPNVYKAAPSDVATPDAIVHALYGVISGPAGTRDWERFRNLFDPKALMAAIYRGRGGQLHHFTFNPDYYVQTDTPYFEKSSFYEREVKRRIEHYGQIAQVFSTYESRHKKTDEKPFETGINSLLLYQDNGRWWILSILWQGDDSGVPVPKEYR